MFMSDKLGMVDNKMLDEISEKIWSSFNILRGEIGADDFHLVLFFTFCSNSFTLLAKFGNCLK